MNVSTADETAQAEALREAMVTALRGMNAIRGEEVADAFRAVPRHLFAPGEPLEGVYAADSAVVTKRDERGAAVSALSSAHIQATMLEQAQLGAGMRVLEIGSGGCNAALIAELVGVTGQVTTVDIDPDVADRAQDCLAAAGYGKVNVVVADADGGVPEHAPYDRVIVTASAWDVPPAWPDQLSEGGRIVVPLRMRGLTRSVAFERDGDHLVSRGYHLCGFVPMQGAGAHTERLVSLDGDRVSLWIDGDQPVEADRLRDALFAPRVERWSGMEFGPGEPLHDLDLWVATVVDDFGLLKATQEAIDSGLASKSALFGGKAMVTGGSFAYRAAARPVDAERTRFEFGAYAHGPDAARLAEDYVDLIQVWDRDHRGGLGARIEVYSEAASDATLPPGRVIKRVINKRHTRVVISWPDRDDTQTESPSSRRATP
ncbi:MAG: methyltransferase, FxLD system [Egibacteraceae bacterium]